MRETLIVMLGIVVVFGICRIIYLIGDLIYSSKERKEYDYDKVLDGMTEEDWDDLYKYLYHRDAWEEKNKIFYEKEEK